MSVFCYPPCLHNKNVKQIAKKITQKCSHFDLNNKHENAHLQTKKPLVFLMAYIYQNITFIPRLQGNSILAVRLKLL